MKNYRKNSINLKKCVTAGTDPRYWSNQATGIVADEVEELKMQPAMWGEFNFE